MENPVLFPQNRELLGKLATNPNYLGPFSPLQMEALSKNQENPQENSQATEVWSIGITLLSYASCCRFSTFYDWAERLIRFDLIEEALIKLKNNGFSHDIVGLIRSMTEEEERNRPTIDYLIQSIKTYQQRRPKEAMSHIRSEMIDTPPQSPRQMNRLFSSNLNSSTVQEKDPLLFIQEDGGVRDSVRSTNLNEVQEAEIENHISHEMTRGQAALQNPNLVKILGHKIEKPTSKSENTNPSSLTKLQPSKTVASYTNHRDHGIQQANNLALKSRLVPLSFDGRDQIKPGTSESIQIKSTRTSASPLQRAFPDLSNRNGNTLPPYNGFTNTKTQMANNGQPLNGHYQQNPVFNFDSIIKPQITSHAKSGSKYLPQKSAEPVRGVNLYLNHPNTQPSNQIPQTNGAHFVNLYGRPESRKNQDNNFTKTTQIEPQFIHNPQFNDKATFSTSGNTQHSSIEISKAGSADIKRLFESMTAPQTPPNNHDDNLHLPSVQYPQTVQLTYHQNNFVDGYTEPNTFERSRSKGFIDFPIHNAFVNSNNGNVNQFTMPPMNPASQINNNLQQMPYEPYRTFEPSSHSQQVQNAVMPPFIDPMTNYNQLTNGVLGNVQHTNESIQQNYWINPQNTNKNIESYKNTPQYHQNIDQYGQITPEVSSKLSTQNYFGTTPRIFNNESIKGQQDYRNGQDKFFANTNDEVDPYLMSQQAMQYVPLQATRKYNMSLNNLHNVLPSNNISQSPTTSNQQNNRSSVGSYREPNLLAGLSSHQKNQDASPIGILDFSPKPFNSNKPINSLNPEVFGFNRNLPGPSTEKIDLKRASARKDLLKEEYSPVQIFTENRANGWSSRDTQNFISPTPKGFSFVKVNTDELSLENQRSNRPSSREPQNMPLFQWHPRPMADNGKGNLSASGGKHPRFNSVRDPQYSHNIQPTQLFGTPNHNYSTGPLGTFSTWNNQTSHIPYDTKRGVSRSNVAPNLFQAHHRGSSIDSGQVSSHNGLPNYQQQPYQPEYFDQNKFQDTVFVFH